MCSRHHHLYHCMAFWNGYSRRKKNFFQLLSLWMEIVSIEVKWGTQFSEFFKIQTSLGFLGALLIQSIKKMRQAWRKRETKTRFAQGSHAHPEEKRARGKTTDTKMGPDFSQLIFSIPLPFLSTWLSHIWALPIIFLLCFWAGERVDAHFQRTAHFPRRTLDTFSSSFFAIFLEKS